MNATIAPIAHSAIGSSNTPRAFVTTTSLDASSGNSNPSTPSLADCTHRSLAAVGNASRSHARGAPHEKTASASAIAPATSSAVPAYRSSARLAAGSIPGGRSSTVAPRTATIGIREAAHSGFRPLNPPCMPW